MCWRSTIHFTKCTPTILYLLKIQFWGAKCGSHPLPQLFQRLMKYTRNVPICTLNFAKCTFTFSYSLKIQFRKLAFLHPKCVKIVEIKFNETFPKCTISFAKYTPTPSPSTLASNGWGHKLGVAEIYREMVPNTILYEYVQTIRY